MRFPPRWAAPAIFGARAGHLERSRNAAVIASAYIRLAPHMSERRRRRLVLTSRPLLPSITRAMERWPMRQNTVKQLLRQGRPAVGTWLALGSPLGTEWLAHQGFD